MNPAPKITENTENGKIEILTTKSRRTVISVPLGMALTKNPVENQRCLDCGREFHCGIANDTPCWCATEFPALMPRTNAAAGCYCQECLGKRIAARQAAARKSLT